MHDLTKSMPRHRSPTHTLASQRLLLTQHIVNLWYSLFSISQLSPTSSPYHHPPHQILGQKEKPYITLSTMSLGRAGNVYSRHDENHGIVEVLSGNEVYRTCPHTTFSLPVVQSPPPVLPHYSSSAFSYNVNLSHYNQEVFFHLVDCTQGTCSNFCYVVKAFR